MTKFLALGLPLAQVIAAATTTPAKVIGWDDRIGRLEVGREADLAVLELRAERTLLRDSVGGVLHADHRIAVRSTIRAGEVFPARPAGLRPREAGA
jgi:dihydroorotase